MKMEIKADSNVVREQTIEINLADLAIEAGVNRVKVIVTAYSDGRPRQRTLVIPDYMLEQAGSDLYDSGRKHQF
jgi:hypothetical protein